MMACVMSEELSNNFAERVVVVMLIVTDGCGCDVDSDRWWWL